MRTFRQFSFYISSQVFTNFHTAISVFSVVVFINPNYYFKKKDLICLVVPFIYLVLLLNADENKLLNTITLLIAVAHNLPYVAIIYYKIRKHQKRIETISSDTESINLQWLIKLSLLLLEPLLSPFVTSCSMLLFTKCIRIL